MISSENRTCQNCKKDFPIESEDFDFYKKIEVPPPTFCPECREQRRIAFRNERALYKRKCDLCGEEVVSRVSPDKQYKMYCKECWWSDNWDPLGHGRDYDFSKPFFTQFKDLLLSVPHISLFSSNTVNSDWVNQETDDKNCYLNVGGHYNENSGYNTYELHGKNSFDNFWLLSGEFCYEDIYCKHCYKTFFSKNCYDSRDTYFSFDCRNCSNVIGCVGLRNKQFYIYNKAVTKEEFEDFLKNNPFSSRKALSKIQSQSSKVWYSIPHRFSTILKSVNIIGNNITESKNSHNVWDSEKVEDCKNLYVSAWVRDSYDGSSSGATELGYEFASGGGVYDAKFLNFCMSKDPLKQMHSLHIEYCFNTIECSYCFGCVGLKSKKFCILNKAYSEDEYHGIVTKIKEQMMATPYIDSGGRIYKYGEFFPPDISPFGYNETAAIDYYPLSREEAIKNGFLWSDYESEKKHELSDYQIPDDINDVGDDILEKTLKCEISGKPYRVVPMELQFYRQMGLPIPRRSPLQRHKDRMSKLLPRKVFNRQCECLGKRPGKNGYNNTVSHQHGEGKCETLFLTSYSPDRPELVYCEECYQQEIS